MKYQFEKFSNQNARLERRISIRKSYSIGFPTKFYEDEGIKNYQFVELFYDRNNKAIGMHYTNDEEKENTYSIIHSKKGFGGSIVARSFFNTYDIDPKKVHGRYGWEKVELEGVGTLYVIELDKKQKDET